METPDIKPMDAIASIAREVRRKEVGLRDLGDDPPATLCLEFSKALREALSDAGFDAAVIQGKFEVDEPNFEYYDEDWDEDEMSEAFYTPLHYWVEVVGQSGNPFPEPVVADITADQFNDEIDNESDYMEPVEVGPYSFLPRHIRDGAWEEPRVSRCRAGSQRLAGLTKNDVPPAAMQRGKEMLEAVANTMLVGDTDVVDGWFIETHTLGCRNAADEPEDRWLDSHWSIYDEYMSDPRSVVVGDPSDGRAFVTFMPTRKSASRVRAWSRDTLELEHMCNRCGADLSVAGRAGDDPERPLCRDCWERSQSKPEPPPPPRRWWRWRASISLGR